MRVDNWKTDQVHCECEDGWRGEHGVVAGELSRQFSAEQKQTADQAWRDENLRHKEVQITQTNYQQEEQLSSKRSWLKAD